MFPNKRQVKLYVCSKSVEDKKPFAVVKTDPSRYQVRCTQRGCSFKRSFFKQLDGQFHVAEEREHSCDSVFPTVKRLWVCEAARELVQEKGRITPSELSVFLVKKYGVRVDKMMLSNAVADARKTNEHETSPFGLVADFLNAVSTGPLHFRCVSKPRIHISASYGFDTILPLLFATLLDF